MTSLYVLGLIMLLGSPQFDQREAAHKELRYLVAAYPFDYGPLVAAAVRPAAKSGRPGSYEKTQYLLSLDRLYRTARSTHYIPKTVPVWPLCDCWTVRIFGAKLRDPMFVRVRHYEPSDFIPNTVYPCWVPYRRATEEQIREWIYDGMSYETADQWLALMWETEIRVESTYTSEDRIGVTRDQLLEAEKWGWVGYFPTIQRVIPEPDIVPLEGEEWPE